MTLPYSTRKTNPGRIFTGRESFSRFFASFTINKAAIKNDKFEMTLNGSAQSPGPVLS